MSVIIIDVREPYEYEVDHVDGAINIPASRIMVRASELSITPKDAQLVLYCRTGARAESLLRVLRSQGFTNVTNGINQRNVEKMLTDLPDL